MKTLFLLVVICLICGCSDTKPQKVHELSAEYLLLTGEWENLSASNDSNDWLGSSPYFNIKENGTIINKEGQLAQAYIQDQHLYIKKDDVMTLYKIKYDAGFIEIQMVSDNKTSRSLFKRVQNSLVGLWTCISETKFHQVEADGWSNDDWIWSFQGDLSFYNNHTCINRKGEVAQWEMKDSILTITYKKYNINWKVTEHYILTWEKEREGFVNKDLHIYSLVPSPTPTFN